MKLTMLYSIKYLMNVSIDDLYIIYIYGYMDMSFQVLFTYCISSGLTGHPSKVSLEVRQLGRDLRLEVLESRGHLADLDNNLRYQLQCFQGRSRLLHDLCIAACLARCFFTCVEAFQWLSKHLPKACLNLKLKVTYSTPPVSSVAKRFSSSASFAWQTGLSGASKTFGDSSRLHFRHGTGCRCSFSDRLEPNPKHNCYDNAHTADYLIYTNVCYDRMCI